MVRLTAGASDDIFMADKKLLRGIVYKRTLIKDCAEKGFSYIGYSLNETQRIKSWNNHGNKSYGGKKIQEARENYDLKKDWSYVVLEERYGHERDALKRLVKQIEKEYIKKFDSIKHGFNESENDSSNYVHTPEQSAKMVATRMANGSYAHTDATKAKISKTLLSKNLHQSEEAKARISAANKGRIVSEETRQKLSMANKGKVMSPEARAKSSATKKGKPHPISAQGQANIDAARYKIPIEVTDLQGNTKVYESMKAAAEATNLKVGSVSNFLKSGNYSKNGYRFSYKDGIKNLPKQQQKP